MYIYIDTSCITKWGDRIFMNMMEQSPLFLTSLWTMATMVSPERATTLGWTYLGLRCCYAPLWLVLGGESGAPFPQIFVSTFTQYGINVYQALAVIMKVKYGKDIASYFMGNDLIGAGAVSIGFLMYAVGLTPQINMALSGFFGKVDSKKK